MEDCSEYLVNFGGAAGPQKTIDLKASSTIKGHCRRVFPTASFCEVPAVFHKSTKCSYCIPRGKWYATQFPASVGYRKVASILAKSSSYRPLNNGIQSLFDVEGEMGNIVR